MVKDGAKKFTKAGPGNLEGLVKKIDSAAETAAAGSHSNVNSYGRQFN
jgi:hypothetical protein